IFKQFFKIKNVLKDANLKKKSCVVLFLDITDAFGSIKLDRLYQILTLYKVDPKCIDYLRTFYESLDFYVDLNGNATDPFKWVDGLIQGCSLSPLLFMLAMNYLFNYIDTKHNDTCGYDFGDSVNSTVETSMENVANNIAENFTFANSCEVNPTKDIIPVTRSSNKLLLTAFVDDVGVTCKDIATAQTVFDDFNRVCEMLGLRINKSKCAMMLVNQTDPVPESLSDIPIVTDFKY